MADNQITPFQLTDQFTMDNFNQRINETNTALQNKQDASTAINTGNISQQTVDKACYAVDNEDYTAKLRNQGLTPTEITPTINGRIQWQYG